MTGDLENSGSQLFISQCNSGATSVLIIPSITNNNPLHPSSKMIILAFIKFGWWWIGGYSPSLIIPIGMEKGHD